MSDGYELVAKIQAKVYAVQSEHYGRPAAIELHPEDADILRRTFRPPHERQDTLLGIPVTITARAPRGGRVLPPTTQGG